VQRGQAEVIEGFRFSQAWQFQKPGGAGLSLPETDPGDALRGGLISAAEADLLSEEEAVEALGRTTLGRSIEKVVASGNTASMFLEILERSEEILAEREFCADLSSSISSRLLDKCAAL
jgi:hypothetical protein